MKHTITTAQHVNGWIMFALTVPLPGAGRKEARTTASTLVEAQLMLVQPKWKNNFSSCCYTYVDDKLKRGTDWRNPVPEVKTCGVRQS